MSTMAENVIAAGSENRPPMLERSQYDSWQSRMRLYIRGKEHATTRERTLDDLTPEEKISEACDIKPTNIILQGLPPDVYSLMNHHTDAKELWDRVKLLMEGSELSLQERESKQFNEFDKFTGLVVPKFLPTDDPIESLNKSMALLSIVITSRYPQTNNQLRTSSNPRNQATIQDGRVIVQNVQGRHTQSYTGNFARGEGHMVRQCTQPKKAHNSEWFKEKMLLAQAQESGVALDEEQLAFLADTRERVDSGTNAHALTTTSIFQTDDLDAFDSDCDEAPTASVVFMANLTSYDSSVLSEFPNYDTYHNKNVFEQSV
ncbi:hypothetical protein Tco_0944036 [Tanacetum coccineum]